MVTFEGNDDVLACPVDHVMNLVYRIVSPHLPSARVISSAELLVAQPTNQHRRVTNPALITKGAAYINALAGAVEALDQDLPVHAAPLEKGLYFWTYKIKVHTKWALNSGLSPDVVRLLGTIHFS